MTQPTNTLVAAADQADALIVARRAKTLLCVLIFFVLGSAITLFALLRYVPTMRPIVGEPPYDDHALMHRALCQYFVGLLDVAGLILPLLLVAFVAIILQVQLVARAVGTGRSVSALAWAVLLALLMFPWQAVLNSAVNSSDPTAILMGMKVPGVVYTWAELSHPALGAHFAEVNVAESKPLAVLHWARYGLFPLLAMIIVGIVHTKTARGLRQSFGSDAIRPMTDEGIVVPPPQL